MHYHSDLLAMNAQSKERLQGYGLSQEKKNTHIFKDHEIKDLKYVWGTLACTKLEGFLIHKYHN